MQQNNMTSLRDLFEQMPTSQLDEMLNQELGKESPDGNAIRMILDVLWEREKDHPSEIMPQMRIAWEKYQKATAKIDSRHSAHAKIHSWILRGASIAAVCLLMLAVPQEVEADTLFNKLFRMTDSIVEFFAPGYANDNPLVYEFKTDNPGLQQVYDAVEELGITQPVVPMWLPEGYDLVECEPKLTSQKKGVTAVFRSQEKGIRFAVDLVETDVSHEYHKDETDIKIYEKNEIEHTIMRNNDRWVVIWFADNVECSLTLDCQEDTLYQILNSIYVTEVE